MFCPKCGRKNENGKFCAYCGTAINSGFSEEKPGYNNSGYNPGGNIPPQKQPTKKKSKKSKKALIIVIAVILAVALGVGGFFLFKMFQKSDISLSDLEASEKYLVSGTPTKVTFTVKSNEICDEIALYSGATRIADMRDDGQGGDEKAGDKVYSCTVELKENASETTGIMYSCKARESSSNEVKIYYFPTPTESSAEKAKSDCEALTETIKDIENEFTDEEGYVPRKNFDELFEKIKSALEDAKSKNTVLEYSIEDYSIDIKMSSGLMMVYTPKQKGTDTISSDESASIYTFQPCFTDMDGERFGEDFTGYELPEGVDYILQMLDVSASNLRNTLPNYSFPNSNNLDDESVTLEKIRNIGQNQVVLWHGHGYYGPMVKSCLVTGEAFDWEAWWFDPGYFGDCVSNRIINSVLVGYDNVIISSGYIKEYCGNMRNSLVYLAACDSGRDHGLPNAFTDKGATVVANTKTIQRAYNVAMLYGTINEMLTVNPSNGQFYTLSEALAKAKNTYGNDDSDPRYDGIGSSPILFGDRNYRFAEEVPTGKILGKVTRASDRKTPVEDAKIEVFIDGSSFKETTSDSKGNYEIELPIGACEIKISADGYIPYSCFTVISAGADTSMETFLMVVGDESEEGTASGTIINSISGQPAPDVDLTFYKNWNAGSAGDEAVETGKCNSKGEYSVVLGYGNYTVVCEKEGFTKSSFNIVVQKGETPNQDGTITPEISGNDYLITLTWDADPRDVDAHMEGTLMDGDKFHVYYSNKEAYDYITSFDDEDDEDYTEVCSLDYDDRYSYGPEHITLTANTPEPYYYYLHKYEGSGTLASSGAKVIIEQGNNLIAEYHIPTNESNGRYWNVFAIRDGEIITMNTITSSPDTEYADIDYEEE